MVLFKKIELVAFLTLKWHIQESKVGLVLQTVQEHGGRRWHRQAANTTWPPRSSRERCQSPIFHVQNKWLLRFLQILRSNNIRTTSHCISFKAFIMKNSKHIKVKRREQHPWPSSNSYQHVSIPGSSTPFQSPTLSTKKQTPGIITFTVNILKETMLSPEKEIILIFKKSAIKCAMVI